MASMPIHNETDYPLTAAMQQHIVREAHEHFGEQVRSIRVQSGLARHAFNARTHEVRYAFFPTDFGVIDTGPPAPETSARAMALPDLDEALEDERLSVLFDDVDTETVPRRATSLERLEPEMAEEEDEDVFRLDTPIEDAEEDEDASEDEEDPAFDSDDNEE